MLLKRPVQFAITREDPNIEIEIIERNQSQSVLLICSAGDTILALKEKFPSLAITAFDFNPHQIAHFQKKASGPFGQLHCREGNFESLFRSWARFFREFIVENPVRLFESGKPFPEEIFESPYWPVSFDMHFHDSFLRAMFGEAAIQHAPKGSYPRYFQKVFEKGLRRPEFATNPFLQLIFLDMFLGAPMYLHRPPNVSDVKLITGGIDQVKSLSEFDLIQLSNIFDWSSENEIRSTCRRLADEMKTGSIVLLRQINNDSPLAEFLGPKFKVDSELGKKLVDRDRSLFYSNIIVARKKA
jgi:S-adenosylmethionine-diacylglycerol 3-amino-3-carboxypropyl transferase